MAKLSPSVALWVKTRRDESFMPKKAARLSRASKTILVASMPLL